MKNAKAYKSVLYEDESFDVGFWDGRATDKQTSDNNAVSISEYWIKEFLRSDFRTTPAAGTRRFAVSLKKAIDSSNDISVKSEISSAIQLVKGLPSTSTSMSDICTRFNFSDATRKEIYKHLPNSDVVKEKFVFLSSEFDKYIQYRSIELDNGGRLVAEAARFEEVFEITHLKGESKVEISTKGEIVDEKLRKSK